MAGEPHANGSAAAEAQASKKRKRETDDQDNVSACNHPSPPDRASVEPGVRCRPDREAKAGARQGEADSGTQGPYGDADLALDVDLSAALAAESGVAEEAAAAAAAASFLPLDGELEEELPMVVDPSSPSAEPMAAEGPPAAAAATPAATVVEELSLCAPAEAQAAVGLPPAPSKQESALLPQCAIMAGRGLEPTEISTHHRVGGEAATAAAAALPLSPRYPSQQYLAVKAELATGIISPRQAGVSWEHFPNHLGEGVRSRLLALATLHLRPGSSAPAAVKELAANSNRVLLGAATNCELYQERVIRALAQKVGAPLLVADMYSLKLDEVLKEEGGAGLDEPFGLVGGFPPDPWEASDEDDPFLGLPKADKKEGGKEASLDTALAMRNKAAARRNVPGIAYLSLSLPGARHPPASMAAATAAAAATEQAAKEVCERADAVAEKVKGAHAKMAVLRSGVPDSHLPAAGIAAAAKPPAAGATTAALCEMQEEVLNATHLLAVAMDKEGKHRQLMEKGEDAPAPATAAATATQQPAASAVASGTGPCEAGEKMATLAALPSVTFPAASAAPAGGGGGGAAPPAAATQQAGTSMAVSKVTPPAVRRGDRISYVGKVHPSLAAAQERLDQLQVAINRVESSSSQRARDYLPQLLVRRTLVAAQSQRMPRMQGSSAPPIGSKGRVVGVTDDKLQVVFDEPFSGGINLAGQKDKCGFSCTPEDLQVIEDKEDPLVSSLQALFDVIAQAADSGPIIAFIQNLDRLLRTHATDHFRKLETLLAALPPRCLLFASYCSRSLARSEAKREGGPPSLSRFFGSLGGDTSFGGGGAGAGTTLGGDDASLLDRFGRGPGRSQRKSTKGKLLSKMLPNHLELHPPNQEAHAKAWKKMVEADVATMRQRSNRTALRKAFARCGCACDEWDAVSITDCQLVRKDIEQIVGMAVAQQLSAEGGGMEQDTAAVPAAAAAVVEGAKVAAKEPAATDEAAPTEDTAAAAAAATLERSGSVAVMVAPAASSAAEVPFPAGAEARDQQQQQVAAVSAPAADQPCTMQTDEAEGGGVAAAAPAKQPNASTATVGAAAAVDPGGTTTVEAGEKVVPLWTLRAEHIMVAAEAIRKVQAEAAAQPEKQALRDVAVDQYEKQLLSEIIPPEEISVSFDDIGALDSVKNTLHEVVILPLQRPELFTRGTLAKPTKGLLLFGPPGTGKTMLAKAVASESGAHFINVNMSAITSKWFGEGERLVRALFGLAHKLSPSVIFVDEIDSFLSKRGQSNNEHEALRKMKNEFMTHWDGLRTKQSDRVLVLAATNRPMDLDDAVIRRMPRRIFVPLPDAANRERILQVILKDEDLDPAFDFKEAASVADGYSGSDLKNLCIAAAYCPIREYLEAERAAKAVEKAAAAQAVSGEGGTASSSAGSHARAAAAFAAAASSATPAALVAVATAAVAPEPVQLRKITMADFKDALKQVTASTHSDSATMGELRRWNDQYGEGGTRSKEVLAYFM